MIEKEKMDLHSVYCERNMTQCSYCKAKLNKKHLDVHVREERGEPMDLVEAIQNGRLESIQTMMDHGNDIYKLDDKENTLLHHAVRNMQLKSLQLLLRKGLNMNAQNKNGETPLHLLMAKEKREGDLSLIHI